MLPDGRRLGAHLPLGAGMVKAADRAHEIGASAIQIFGDNPTAWRRRANPPKEQSAFRGRLRLHDIAPVAIHASYLINLAGPDDDFFTKSVAILAHDLSAATGFGATLVNVHAGSDRGAGREAGMDRLAIGVRTVLDQVGVDADVRLVLENSAGGGFGVGVTIEDLSDIADGLAAEGVPPSAVGFCLDTAHLWGAGYALDDPDEVDRVVARFAELVGLDRLAMMHLNDSKAALGSKLDRHQHIGAGEIGERGMARLLTHPSLRHVPTFVETPGMDEGYDAINVARALALATGGSLEPLPPEAMELRGSRYRTRPEPAPDEDEAADEEGADDTGAAADLATEATDATPPTPSAHEAA